LTPFTFSLLHAADFTDRCAASARSCHCCTQATSYWLFDTCIRPWRGT
jgi:hypothetical protein